MVGNAEPVKEYNYRPLSKLCECQLDVNDQVSTKGWREGGRAEMEGRERRRGRDRKRGSNFFSSLSPSVVPAPSRARPCRTQPFWANTVPRVSHGCRHHCPGLGPPGPAGVVTQVTCPCLQQANKSKQPETKNSCKTIARFHINPVRARHPGAVRPRALHGAGARVPGVTPESSRLPSRVAPRLPGPRAALLSPLCLPSEHQVDAIATSLYIWSWHRNLRKDAVTKRTYRGSGREKETEVLITHQGDQRFKSSQSTICAFLTPHNRPRKRRNSCSYRQVNWGTWRDLTVIPKWVLRTELGTRSLQLHADHQPTLPLGDQERVHVQVTAKSHLVPHRSEESKTAANFWEGNTNPKPFAIRELKTGAIFPFILELSPELIKAVINFSCSLAVVFVSHFQHFFLCAPHKLLKRYFIYPSPCDRNRFSESKSCPNQFCLSCSLSSILPVLLG